jgi:hypothetical protein
VAEGTKKRCEGPDSTRFDLHTLVVVVAVHHSLSEVCYQSRQGSLHSPCEAIRACSLDVHNSDLASLSTTS